MLRDGLLVGCVKFKLSVLDDVKKPDMVKCPVGDAARTYDMAFVSYASADRTEVLKRLQILAALRIVFFQDIRDLSPGDSFAEKIMAKIDACDLFLLFWSSHAQRSDWVLSEVRRAVSRKAGNDLNPPDIVPVVIEGPPIPTPPPELAHLHFGDPLVHLMRG